MIAKDGSITLFFGKFEGKLARNAKRGNKKGLFVGDMLTVADLKAYISLKGYTVGYIDHVPTTILDGYPNIQKFLKAVESVEKIPQYHKAWDEKRKAAQQK